MSDKCWFTTDGKHTWTAWQWWTNGQQIKECAACGAFWVRGAILEDSE